MKRLMLMLSLVGLTVAVMAVGAGPKDIWSAFSTSAAMAGARNDAEKPRIAEAYGNLPPSFEANQGQSDPRVKFISRGRGYTLFLTGSAEAVLALSKSQPDAKTELVQTRLTDREKPVSTVVRMKLIGASASPHVEALRELPGKANYFIGNDPKKWRTDVPIFRQGEISRHLSRRGSGVLRQPAATGT